MWAYELYQISFILLSILQLSYIDFVAASPTWRHFVVVIFAYRLADIFVFILDWIFVADVKVHLYRRSVAGFFLNLSEVALYVTSIAKSATVYWTQIAGGLFCVRTW